MVATSAPRSKTRRMRATIAGSARTQGKRIVATPSCAPADARPRPCRARRRARCGDERRRRSARRRARARRRAAAWPASRRAAGRRAAASRRRALNCRRRLAAQRARRPAEQLRKVSLKRRTLPKPAASATSAIGRRVSWISCLANSTRRVWATATGEAPRCCWNRRRSWRSPTPSRSASASTSPPRRRARRRRSGPGRGDTVLEVPRQAARSGAISGRQRRQGRKPASCGGGGRGEEAAVLELRRARRADRPAVDAGRGDADEEAAVEAGVAGLEGAVAGSAIEQVHDGNIVRASALVARGFRT